jgi:hypothetical protein
MQRAPCDVSSHPLSILGPTQSISAQKPFCGWNAQSVEAAAPAGAALRLENRIYLARSEITYASDRKTGKVDRYLCVRNCHVARDGLGRRARCTPIPFFLRCGQHTEGQHRSHDRAEQSFSLHVLSMTFIESLSKPQLFYHSRPGGVFIWVMTIMSRLGESAKGRRPCWVWPHKLSGCHRREAQR